MSKKEKVEIKTDQKCKQYLHNHCMNTVDHEYGTSIARQCNLSAGYCDRKNHREKKK